jgi:hypothetical protein
MTLDCGIGLLLYRLRVQAPQLPARSVVAIDPMARFSLLDLKQETCDLVNKLRGVLRELGASSFMIQKRNPARRPTSRMLYADTNIQSG